jgi:hypothetical protein
MIVFFYNSGRLGNRLFMASYLISLGIVAKRKVLNLSFNEYTVYFEGTKKNPTCLYPKKSTTNFLLFNRTIINSLLYRLYKLTKKFSFLTKLNITHIYTLPFDIKKDNVDATIIGKEIKKIKALIIFYDSPWHWYDSTNYLEYETELNKYFKIHKTIRLPIEKSILELREKKQPIIALHIRQGDYKNWAGGAHFYTNEQYANFINEFSKTLDITPIFIIFSDGTIDASHFKNFSTIISEGTDIEDIYKMSLCDYIIGPPSTYSAWASMSGKVPLYRISDIKIIPKLEEFKVNANRSI